MVIFKNQCNSFPSWEGIKGWVNKQKNISVFNELESDVNDLIELIAYEIKSRTDD